MADVIVSIGESKLRVQNPTRIAVDVYGVNSGAKSLAPV